MASVHELAHTADIGFEVRADDLPGLFEAAAEGLARARGAEPDRSAPVEEEGLRIRRPGLDRLLVAWLRELLHRSEREGRVASAAVEEVRAPEPDGGAGRDGDEARLSARVAWRPQAGGPVREIKGVTYHGLDVRRDDGGWHARVVLDV